jgi:GxxExxY protein
MDTDAHEWESDLTEVVIGAGFLEKVYQRALIHEAALRGVSAKAQVSFPISYKGKYLGEYAADLVVGEVI